MFLYSFSEDRGGEGLLSYVLEEEVEGSRVGRVIRCRFETDIREGVFKKGFRFSSR